MCNALCECLKCPAKVVCCCFSCTMQLLCSILCSTVVLLVIIGLILWFTVFQHKDNGSGDASTESVKNLMSAVTPTSFRDFFNKTH